MADKGNQCKTDKRVEEDGDGLEDWEEQRNHHKAQGDSAFRSSDFKTAIQEYTNAITFDPEFHILYSNRSAAHLSNGEKSKALVDARKCVEIKPDFVKGHSRLAASLGSLGRWNEARAVYKHILTHLDQDNAIAKKGIEDCRERELRATELKMEMMRKAQKAENVKEAEEKEKETKHASKVESATANEDSGDDEDDLLNDFFDEVEETVAKKTAPTSQDESNSTEQSPKDDKENKIQVQMSELVDTKTQVDRIMRQNHEWYNLNPFRALDISHHASTEMIARRYRAISLLLHPDKVRTSATANDELVERAEQAFEYVQRAMNSLKDETKAKHFFDLIEQGMKQGKRDYERSNDDNQAECLKEFQDKATMKIFAEIERKRRDVERRKRKQDQRERSQEDEEMDKVKKERNFEKNWKEGTRVEKRIGNWRSFQKDKQTRH